MSSMIFRNLLEHLFSYKNRNWTIKDIRILKQVLDKAAMKELSRGEKRKEKLNVEKIF